MRKLLTGVLLIGALGASQPGRAPGRELENVAAFARLYGVVRYFYPSDVAAGLDWNRFAVDGVQHVRAAGDAKALEAALERLFGPLGSGIEIGPTLTTRPALQGSGEKLVAWRYFGPGFEGSDPRGPYQGKRTYRARRNAGIDAAVTLAATLAPELFEEAPPSAGDSVDVDLGSGLKARVPLVLSDAQAAVSAQGSPVPQAVGEQQELNTRLADIVVAWNVFRHYYPYWPETGVDWDARLRPQLENAYLANGPEAQRDALRRLVADARDGHGAVIDTRSVGQRSSLPVRLGAVEGQVVIIASTSADAPVGATVSTIDGVPAGQRLAAIMRLSSGTTQWQQSRALQEIVSCPAGAKVTLVLDDGAGARSRTLGCEAKPPPLEKRPEAIVELATGVWYVDITRASMLQITPVLPTLARAAGVVFDVRGYPTDAGGRILPHLIGEAETDRWMHVAKITGPFGRSAGWHSVGWNLKPATPRVSGKIVFLTDGRAISYAESVMGYIADRKLATIVGSTTAGTNGNVATFGVPGGFRIAFTGMRVTGHDGKTPHHLVGVKPDVPVAPTIAGLRAGRDEVLERGLALVR